MTKLSRRHVLRAGVLAGLGGLATSAESDPPVSGRRVTPPEIEGPFYPVVQQKDKDFDLTQVDGIGHAAQGTVIEIHGRVLDHHGHPVEDVSVELWQANAAGRYAHPHDRNPAPLDPGFQGWAVVLSGQAGEFRFKSIMPGSYPAAAQWSRPPHIHFKVAKRGYAELTTQMYFPGHALNAKDRLLQAKSQAEQKAMIARQPDPAALVYHYDIVLKRLA